MKKIELLSPVGDFECLKAAVQNGADSVYFGATSFSARASAKNFDLEAMKEAICYAKLRGVSTHLTLNTLVSNGEFAQALEVAKVAYESGIDAIIVQDLGLATTLIKTFPDLPIHASTQLSVHNLEGCLQLEKTGFKRAVLSRELSIDEIKYICDNTSIEIETFIHGALCISYSGQCLFSSMIGGRSGNRGKCAQPCRLPYDLVSKPTTPETSFDNSSNNLSTQFKSTTISSTFKPKTIDKGYLLSTRDLCGLEFIPSLIEAGVDCFKIEGRMKTPEYVAIVTKIYRKYIDLYYSSLESKSSFSVEKDDLKALMQVFNRGGFSGGHLSNSANKDLVYKQKQNNMGIYVGNVSNIKPQKAHVFMNLTDEIEIGDTIQFENEPSKYTISEIMIKNKNLKQASSGMLVEIGRMKGNINKGAQVYKLSSKKLSTFAEQTYKSENKKIELQATIIVKKDTPIELSVSTISSPNAIYDELSTVIKSEVCPEIAKSHPIEKERIINQLSKTNNTIYHFAEIKVELDDGLFIPSISVINELRRTALDNITNSALKRIKRDNKYHFKNLNCNSKNSKVSNKTPQIAVLLNILEPKYDYSKLEGFEKVYIPLKYFANQNSQEIIKKLNAKFKIYIYLPTIIKTNITNLVRQTVEDAINNYNISGFIFSNISGGSFIEELNKKYERDFEYIANYTLNVYNNFTIEYLNSIGTSAVTVSPELNKEFYSSLCDGHYNTEMIVYGNTPLMQTSYCLLGKTNKCYPTCGAQCSNNNKYYLKDRLGFEFRVLPDKLQTVTTIYNSKITSIMPGEFKNSSLRIDILDETIEEINNIVNCVKLSRRLEGHNYTNGNMNREI